MRISASRWNRLLDRLAAHWPLGFLAGYTFGWQHPWQTSASWNATEERWEATVRPGFVNGKDVTVEIEGEDGERQDVPLTDSPAIPLTSFRSIGTDAISVDGSGESVPDYFKALGVGDPASFSTDGEDGFTQQISGLLSSDSEKRLLRACEILLYNDRPAASAQWTTGVGIDGSFAQFAIAYNLAPGARDHGYLRIAKEMPVASADSDPATAAFLGEGFEDQSYDWRQMVTVYLLSPAGAALDSEPDETWEAHIQHHRPAFWNLNYAHTPIPAAANNQPLTLNTAGLGGAAVNLQATVNAMLAQSNDAMQALREMTRQRVQGTFWTI